MFRIGPLAFVVISVVMIVAGNSLARVIGLVILGALLALVARRATRRRA